MYRIGALAQASGVSRDTLRFYEREGLLCPEGRSEGGYRLYSEGAFQRLRFIKQAQALGLSLEEIRAVLEVMHEGRPPCTNVRQILRQKVALLEERITQLTALRDALASRLEWAEAHPDLTCDGKDRCVYLDPTTVQH